MTQVRWFPLRWSLVVAMEGLTGIYDGDGGLIHAGDSSCASRGRANGYRRPLPCARANNPATSVLKLSIVSGAARKTVFGGTGIGRVGGIRMTGSARLE